ncbi:MAG: acyltransferase [Lewinellaceae bacterium]|nr:acyltransferase [Lewinellaceae bacterium]MCB9354015.1 acyltransferase [Lewinellaceae bacterium]
MSGQPSHEILKHRIPALDGLRGIAIALVMLSHFLLRSFWTDKDWYTRVQGGWLGVDLFFVLSGFLITGILIDSKGRADYWSSFYKRRILRIFPLYYFSVIVVWLTVIFWEQAPGRLHGYDSFFWYFSFTPNIAMALKNNWLYHSHVFNLNHLWSLAVEEQFYLLWPLVVRWLPLRWLAAVCVALLCIATPARHWVDGLLGDPLSTASYVLPFCRMDGLAAGSFLAVFFRLDLQHFIPYDKWLARIALCWSGYEIAGIFVHGTEQRLFTLSALFFGAMLYLSLNTHPRALIRRICENRFLMHLGKYSYGLYVFHLMFEYAWLRWFGKALISSTLPPALGQTIYLLLAFAGTYALARLSWALIERPFLRMKKTWAARPAA